MNSRVLLIVLACTVVAALGAWFFFASSRIRPTTTTSAPPPPPKVVPPTPATAATPLPSVPPTPKKTLPPGVVKAEHEAEVKREQAIVSAWILTPITFYGKVVDEKQTPVSDASVTFSAADHPFAGGSKYQKTSDADGLFSISGIHGAALQVTVTKDGYYSLPQSWGNFGYATRDGTQPPHADANDPAIFVLRKKGESEPIIVQQKDVNLNNTGTPATMDLRTGNTRGVSNPDIQVQAWAQPLPPGSHTAYDWRCLITVPGGGIQLRTGDEFDFTAPENGYQPTTEIDMPANSPHWSTSQTREYYLQLANGEYARINFIVAADNNPGFTITSYLNPTPGHRNLEYDPNQTTAK